MTQYAIQAVEAGTWGISAWMLDDNSHYNFSWGLWGYKSEGFPLKPWFYTWSLLSRYFPANSKFSLLDGLPPNVEGLAAELPPAGNAARGWSFVFVNTGETPISVRVDFRKNSAPVSNRYLFADGIAPKDDKGFPIPYGTLKSAPGAKTSLELPPRSVTFLARKVSRSELIAFDDLRLPGLTLFPTGHPEACRKAGNRHSEDETRRY